MMIRRAWPLVCLLLACKFEPIERLELVPEPRLRLPDQVIPLSTERLGDRTAERWDDALQRYIDFLTGPELSGRRPGTPGATLTEGLVISVLEGTGISPSGPDLGWTQPVGIRVVTTRDVELEVHVPPVPPAARRGAPEREALPEHTRFTEGLWLRHRGAAGEHLLSLRLSGPATAPAPPTAEPEAGPRDVLRLLEPPEVSEGTPAGEIFRDVLRSAWRDGASVAVLPVPGEDQAQLRAAAAAWQQPDLQSLLPGADPPAALDLEGFVSPEAYQLLLDAQAQPESTAELRYVTDERWISDANVIGRIAGEHHPEQVVVLVAHWDAGGLSEPDEKSNSVANASGLAVMLAVAESVGLWRREGRRPGRSIVFLATAAGTLGHRGAARFLEASGIRPSNIVAVINLEGLGGTASNLLVFDGERSSLTDNITALEPTARAVPDEGELHGHRPFLERDIPAVTLSRPIVELEDGTEPEPSLPALRNDAELTFQLLWALSDREDLPRLVEAEAPEPEEPEAQG